MRKNTQKKQKTKPMVRHYATNSEVQMLQSCGFSFGTGDSEFSITARTGEELLAILQFAERYSMVKKLLYETE